MKKVINGLYKQIDGINLILISSKPNKNDLIVNNDKIHKVLFIEKKNGKEYFCCEGNKFTIKQFLTVFVCNEFFSDMHLTAIADKKIENNSYIKVDSEYSEELNKLVPLLRNGFLVIRKCKKEITKDNLYKKNLFQTLISNNNFEKIKRLKSEKEFETFLKSL